MDDRQALSSFAALSQDTRLQIVRTLVVAGHEGLAAGSIAQRLGVSASNLSFHLKDLVHANLIAQRRESRSLVYTANYDALTALVTFLLEDCCAGRPKVRTSVEACCRLGADSGADVGAR
jgi:DNA-binding transcriptional ArsR family regulator